VTDRCACDFCSAGSTCYYHLKIRAGVFENPWTTSADGLSREDRLLIGLPVSEPKPRQRATHWVRITDVLEVEREHSASEWERVLGVRALADVGEQIRSEEPARKNARFAKEIR
jgi:hypothetical protein